MEPPVPGSLTEEVHPRGGHTTHQRPSPVKGWSTPAGPREQLKPQLPTEGAACFRVCNSSRAGPGFQGAGGHGPGSCAPPGIGKGREGTGQ